MVLGTDVIPQPFKPVVHLFSETFWNLPINLASAVRSLFFMPTPKIKDEGLVSWLKTYVRFFFFRLEPRQWQWLSLAGLHGTTALPTPDLVLGQGNIVSEGSCGQEFRSFSLVMFCHVFLYAVLGHSFLGLFIWHLGPRSSSDASAKAFLWGEEVEHLKIIFPTLTQYPLLFYS